VPYEAPTATIATTLESTDIAPPPAIAPKLQSSALVSLSAAQSHYLVNVMRLSQPKRWGDLANHVRIFNGKDGEWLAKLAIAASSGGNSGGSNGKRGRKRQRDASVSDAAVVECIHQLRTQTDNDDNNTQKQKLNVYMAPLKKQQRKWALEKLTELGVDGIYFLNTEFAAIDSKDWDAEKNYLHVWEAAEQCERLTVPVISNEIASLQGLMESSWSSRDPSLSDDEDEAQSHAWLICQERSKSQPLAKVLQELQRKTKTINILVGPEGGWSPSEIEQFARYADVDENGNDPVVRNVSLGPLILRAETACITSAAAVMLHNEAQE